MARAGRKRKSGPRMVGGRLKQPSKQPTLPHGFSAVYVMYAEGSSVVKVGVSRSPAVRCTDIQVGMPLNLHIRGCFVMPSDVAATVERSFHKTHRGLSHHVRGEWYRVDPDEACRLIAKEAAKFGFDLSSAGSRGVSPHRVSNQAYLTELAP